MLLNEFQKVKFQTLKKDLEDFKIHPGQVPMLFIISKNPGISQIEIAEKIHVTPSTVAIMIRRMEKARLVKRVKNEKDRRELKVYLTENAQELVEKIFKKLKNFEAESLKDFTEDEIKTLENLLKKILKNLEAIKDDETV
jgi:DNA-binding MarR family transcriptional regulator